MSSIRGETLLHYLDARVHRGAAFATATRDRDKTICVGVRHGGGTRWWVARLGAETSTELRDTLPAVFDAGLAMDSHTAMWVLGTERQRGPLHLKTGDVELLERFVANYVAPSDLMSMRLRGAL